MAFSQKSVTFDNLVEKNENFLLHTIKRLKALKRDNETLLKE